MVTENIRPTADLIFDIAYMDDGYRTLSTSGNGTISRPIAYQLVCEEFYYV